MKLPNYLHFYTKCFRVSNLISCISLPHAQYDIILCTSDKSYESLSPFFINNTFNLVFRECVYDYLLSINLVIRAFVNGYTRKYILLKRAKNCSGFLSPSSLLARRFCRHFLIYSCSSWYSRRHSFNYSLSIWMAVS